MDGPISERAYLKDTCREFKEYLWHLPTKPLLVLIVAQRSRLALPNRSSTSSAGTRTSPRDVLHAVKPARQLPEAVEAAEGHTVAVAEAAALDPEKCLQQPVLHVEKRLRFHLNLVEIVQFTAAIAIAAVQAVNSI